MQYKSESKKVKEEVKKLSKIKLKKNVKNEKCSKKNSVEVSEKSIESLITSEQSPPIPHICHLDHLHVGGEKICHVKKFQISIHEISPHEEEFSFFHTTDVEKCDILPNLEKFHISPQDRCEEI